MEDKQVVSVTPRTARRRFTKQFKRELVQQAMLPEVSMAALALANDINPNQLARWCREHRRADGAAEIATLVPVNIAPAVTEFDGAPSPAVAVGEIEWRHGTSSVVVRGNVDIEILRTIISQTLASSRAA
jgi:transposase-like protein